MPFDGTTLAAVACELNNLLLNGRVDKIAQPEPDEIVLSLRGHGRNHKLLLSANASSPRVHLTAASKHSPLQAPMFCMLLRKHLSGGRLVAIEQPDYERILVLHIESLNEMGDRSVKRLLIEIMGKHSNIMLLDEHGTVLDAIKHVSHEVSAVREVLPGKLYTRPPSGGKTNPLQADAASFAALLSQEDKQTLRLQQVLYQSYNGISPIMASEICEQAQLASDRYVSALENDECMRLFAAFDGVFAVVRRGWSGCDEWASDGLSRNNPGADDKAAPDASGFVCFDCRVYVDDTNKPIDCTALPLTVYAHTSSQTYTSPSAMLEAFYRQRDNDYRLAQKTADLRKLVNGQIERCVKKQLMYDNTLADIADRDRFRIYGELLTAYFYKIEKGAKACTVENFYDEGTEITIPLDETLTPTENAQAYFKQYNKQKRTFAALQEQMKQNTADLAYLDSVSAGLQMVTEESDIADIRAELAEQGFIKKIWAKRTGRSGNSGHPGHSGYSTHSGRSGHSGYSARSGRSARSAQMGKKSKPLYYLSSDGFAIYVGKNNTQNDELTLRFAQNGDMWLHTKDIAGSHVIIRTNNNPLPERTLHEAAHLAAYHSKGRGSSQVPVDYVIKKHVRKPSGAKPGFVIYDHHKTAYVTPDEQLVRRLGDNTASDFNFARTPDDTIQPTR